MSFNHYAHKVRNHDLPLGTRVSALRSCIRLLSELQNEGFTQTINRFDERFSFNWVRDVSTESPPEENLISTLIAVEAERNSLLENTRIAVNEQRATKIPKKKTIIVP